MTQGSIDNLYYSQNNLDNAYNQVADEILRRTNKNITNNSNYKVTFNKMAKMVFDKIPQNERNLMKCNSILVDKSVSYFHNKIFQKNVTGSDPNAGVRVGGDRVQTGPGFTMIKDNEDLSKKMQEMINNRQTLGTGAGIRGDGNPLSYVPQPTLTQNQVISQPITSTHANQFQRIGDNIIPPANKPTLQHDALANSAVRGASENIDFTIKPFNLSEDITDSLIGSDTQDIPLYQNIENLQKMDGVNPMSMLEDYTRQRNKQAQDYMNIEKRENITALKTYPLLDPQKISASENIILSRNNTDAITKIDQTMVDPMQLFNQGNKWTDKYIERMEERIVNDNNIQTIEPELVEENQGNMIKLQRDVQPKYIEKVHYININSVDRDWVHNLNEDRYNFQVKFNQNQDYTGSATVSQLYRNVISVELVSAVMPMDAFIEPFDTRIYMGLSRYPYLLLRIEELDNVFKGTNNWVDKAFSTMIFDKVFYTNTLSSDYISGYTGFTSIVQSSPRQGFAGEYLRGFMKYNPAYFEKKKYYNNPLASLNRMSIDITDPRGNNVNTQKDVLDITQIQYTGNIGAVTGTELLPTFAWPFSTQGSYGYIKITTSTYFSNRLFRVGDRIIINDFEFNTGSTGINDSKFATFINRPEGHVIINLDVETNGSANTNNRGYINNIYIAPPGTMNSTNQTIQAGSYYDASTLDLANVKTWGRMIDVDLQTQLLFRIVTRDPDTSGTLQPINVY
jgi:hypothetical protein